MKRLLLLLMLAGAIVFAVWLGMHGKVLTGSSSATVTALLPKETLALVHVPDFGRTREQWHETDLYKLWREPAVQEFLQKPLANAPSTGTLRTGIDDLDALGMRDAFIALTAWRDNQPEIAAGFRFKGTADDAEKVIGKWRNSMDKIAPGTTRSTMTHAGHQLQLVARDNVTWASVYDGDWFLAANGVELLKTLVDRVDGRVKDESNTLASDDRYSATFKHMPVGYAIFAYGRVDQYLETLAAQAPDRSSNQQLEMARRVQSIAAATTFSGGKMHDVLFVGMPKSSDEGELTRNSLGLATDQSFLYTANLFHLSGDMMPADPAAASAAPWLGKLQQAIAALGAAGITAADINAAFVPEASVVGDWPENSRLPALLATVPVRDMEKAKQILTSLTGASGDGNGWTQSDKEGVHYYTLAPANPNIPFAPAVAVGPQLLVAGMEARSVEAAMERARSGSSPLASSQPYKAADTLVPKPGQSFTFIDTALLYGRLDAALRPMLIMAAAFAPGLANSVDLGKLPAADVITNHLSPIVMSRYYDNDGYVTESIGPVSLFQAALGIAGASGAARTFYQRHVSGRSAPGLPVIPSAPATTLPKVTPPSSGTDPTAGGSPAER
ncbi:hypothetical protein BH18VER1_BH18VER1_16930 [soil metagenome]